MSTIIAPRRARGRRRILLAAPLLLIALIWAAPYIVAGTGLRHWVLGRFFPRIEGSIVAGSASLDWFAPVVFNDVDVADSSGKTILKIGKIRSQKTLLSLLVNPQQAGTFQMDNADLQLHARGREFNLEKVLAGYFTPQQGAGQGTGSSQGKMLNLAVEILNSSISQHDADTQQQIKLEMVSGKVNFASGSTEPVSVELHGTLADTERPGKIDAVFHWLTQDEGHGEFIIETDGMTLAAINPLLRRFGCDLEMDGRVYGQCIYRWGRRANKDFTEIHADLSSSEVLVSGPWLRSDKVALRDVKLPCRLALDGSRVQIEKARLTCDMGTARLAGGIDLEQSIPAWLDEPGCTAHLDVDLARLANQLPNTLRLQRGAWLSSGRAQLDCTSHKTTEGASWQGTLTTTALDGVRDGRAVSWPEGFHFDFRVHQNKRGLPEIDRLHGQSKFLRIDGSGNDDQFQVRLDLDLAKLAEPLGQFVDLDAWHLQGDGWARLAVRRTDEETYAVESSGQFKNLHVFTFKDPAVDWRTSGVWTSPDRLQVDDALVNASVFSLQTSGLQITGLGKRDPQFTGKAVVTGEVSQLRHWLTRAATSSPVTGDVLAYIDISDSPHPYPLSPGGRGEGVRGPSRLTLDTHFSNVVIGNPKAPTWREPRVRIYTQSSYFTEKELLQFERFYLETAALATDTKGSLEFNPHPLPSPTGGEGIGVRGKLDLHGKLRYDLAKLQPVLQRYLGAGSSVSGSDTRRLQLSGPIAAESGMALAALSGTADLGWRTLQAYGSEIGPADLRLHLDNGWLHAAPINTTLNGGKLSLEPKVRLQPGPAELLLGAGRVIERARITPELSAGILRYALPAIAGVSRIDGELSLSVDRLRLPLTDVPQTELHGKLHVHSARFGGTKLVQDLGDILKAPPPTVMIKDCTVPVKMTAGKVYHENLDLIFPDATVRTSGWVALDGEMELLAEIPIPERWVIKISPALANHTVKLPIRGTLERPTIDDAALRSATSAFLRDSAGKVLQREVEDRLKKLFQR